MALLDSKQLNPKLTGSFILSGSTQTLIGSSDFQGSVTASGDISGSGNITADNFTGTFNGAISGSAQIADNISGSFTAPSASFSTRITNLKTDSGSFSTRVTNLKIDSDLVMIAGILPYFPFI